VRWWSSSGCARSGLWIWWGVWMKTPREGASRHCR